MLGWFSWIASFFRVSFLGRDDRCLFRYWDGKYWRSIDPVAAYRAIWTSPDCDLLQDSRTAANPFKEDGGPLYPIQMVYEAEDKLRTMTREIFGVKEWSEGNAGLTLDETDTLLNSFMDFCADLKKKRNQSAMSSAPLESTAPPASLDSPIVSGGPESPAGVDPDYCCSASESTAAAPIGP